MTESMPERMPLFGTAHITMLVLCLALCVLSVWAVRRWRGTKGVDRAVTLAGWGLLTLSLAWIGWGLLPGNWDPAQSLPLHLSDVLQIVTAVALIARPAWAVTITYYWGLTLNLQSLLTPDLVFTIYPPLQFTMYWVLHILVFLAPVVFTFGLGYRPSLRGFVLTYACTAGWAGVAVIVNLTLGTNYGYLSHAPAGGSLLDFLGPWPFYLLSEAVLVAAVWALMTWPWTRFGRGGTAGR